MRRHFAQFARVRFRFCLQGRELKAWESFGGPWRAHVVTACQDDRINGGKSAEVLAAFLLKVMCEDVVELSQRESEDGPYMEICFARPGDSPHQSRDPI